MRLVFKESFTKDLRGIKDKSLLRRLGEVLESIERAPSLQEIANVKRLHGGGNAYRVRIGDYRIGLRVEGDAAVLLRFLNRKEMYRSFP